VSRGILRIVKFGGKSLGTPRLVARAADLLRKDAGKGNRLVAVVSAQGSSTDAILSQLCALCKASQRPQAWDLALSYGERLSAALLHSALLARQVDSRLYDPTGGEWPIVSDSRFGLARIDFGRTRLLCRSFVEPCLDYMLPVIPGFVARSHDGKITTLGRGGSDLTAFVLARCLGADEVVKVTDVDGFYVEGKRVECSSAESLKAGRGAAPEAGYAKCRSIVQPAAIEHFVPPTVLRIISHKSESLDANGSKICPATTAGIAAKTAARTA
jgi:aspartate kinase